MPDVNPPTVTLTLDKPAYVKGETMTATVRYADPDSKTSTVTVTVTDASGGTGTANIILVVADPVSVRMVDTDGRAWTKTADDGKAALFTATA